MTAMILIDAGISHPHIIPEDIYVANDDKVLPTQYHGLWRFVFLALKILVQSKVLHFSNSF